MANTPELVVQCFQILDHEGNWASMDYKMVMLPGQVLYCFSDQWSILK